MRKTKKIILDAACGSKMFWLDRKNPNVMFIDIRRESHILCDGRKLEISPDIKMDFRHMLFKSESFKLVVFDPPHLKYLGKNSWMAKKYGVLSSTWKEDLKKGFDECWRVLAVNGILIFKWSEKDVKVSEVLTLFKERPLFGHITGKNGKTIWACFMKLKR